jgi:plastocyanin
MLRENVSRHQGIVDGSTFVPGGMMPRIAHVISGLALVLVAASCGGDSGYGGSPTSPPPNTPPSNSSTVTLYDNYFTPQSTTVAKGATVTWDWTTGTTHNVTFDDGPASGNKSGGTYTRTFNTTGTFNYVCTIHQALGMTGTITVQ